MTGAINFTFFVERGDGGRLAFSATVQKSGSIQASLCCLLSGSLNRLVAPPRPPPRPSLLAPAPCSCSCCYIILSLIHLHL
eukprot:357949-Hanusia_phi.AAC.1